MILLNQLVTFLTAFITAVIPQQAPAVTHQTEVKAEKIHVTTSALSATNTPSPSIIKKQTVVKTMQPSITSSPSDTARKIGDHTYAIKFVPDQHMSTPQEAFTALNNFRLQSKSTALQWDSKLAQFAQSRVNYFTEKNSLDQHKGFLDFVWHQNGFDKLGFSDLGENSAHTAGMVNGQHLIEWIFAGDHEHNSNQLNKKWTHVGVGIDGFNINIIFGANPK